MIPNCFAGTEAIVVNAIHGGDDRFT